MEFSIFEWDGGGGGIKIYELIFYKQKNSTAKFKSSLAVVVLGNSACGFLAPISKNTNTHTHTHTHAVENLLCVFVFFFFMIEQYFAWYM